MKRYMRTANADKIVLPLYHSRHMYVGFSLLCDIIPRLTYSRIDQAARSNKSHAAYRIDLTCPGPTAVRTWQGRSHVDPQLRWAWGADNCRRLVTCQSIEG